MRNIFSATVRAAGRAYGYALGFAYRAACAFLDRLEKRIDKIPRKEKRYVHRNPHPLRPVRA
jgi:hypothetical protein